ncbi:MAG TPA: hypothetical protein P5048_04025 [Chlamydiales bacterium]|nr:hypothetical protein [Chlamydiales bacterium]
MKISNFSSFSTSFQQSIEKIRSNKTHMIAIGFFVSFSLLFASFFTPVPVNGFLFNCFCTIFPITCMAVPEFAKEYAPYPLDIIFH